MDALSCAVMMKKVFEARWIQASGVWRVNHDSDQFDIQIIYADRGPHEHHAACVDVLMRLIDEERPNGRIPLRRVGRLLGTPRIEPGELKVFLAKTFLDPQPLDAD